MIWSKLLNLSLNLIPLIFIFFISATLHASHDGILPVTRRLCRTQWMKKEENSARLSQSQGKGS
jgi:hypothetical protein